MFSDLSFDFLMAMSSEPRVVNTKLNTSYSPKAIHYPESSTSCGPKIINDARHILPFRTVRYLPASPIVDNIISTTSGANNAGIRMYITGNNQSQYFHMTDHLSNYQFKCPWISKDVLDKQKIGIFDSFPNADCSITGNYKDNELFGGWSMGALTNKSNAWSSSGNAAHIDALGRGIITYSKDTNNLVGVAASSDLWSLKFTEDVLIASKKYNKDFEERNVGVKELSKRLYFCFSKLSKLLTVPAKTVEDLEDFDRSIKITNGTFPSHTKYKRVPSGKELRDKAKRFTAGEQPAYEVSDKLKTTEATIVDLLFPIKNALQLKYILQLKLGLTLSVEDILLKEGLEADDFGVPIFQNELLGAIDAIHFFRSQVYLNILSYIALGVHYSIRYPGFKDNIRAFNNESFTHNANIYLYSMLLEVIMTLHDYNHFVKEVTTQMLLLHTDTSKEFDEFIDVLGEIYGIIGCCKSRISKISLFNTVHGNIVVPITSGHTSKTFSDVLYRTRSTYPEDNVLATDCCKVHFKELYSTMWAKAMSDAIKQRERRE